MSYDTKCYELAEAFLVGERCVTPITHDALAQVIQDAIEDFLRDRQEAIENSIEEVTVRRHGRWMPL